MAEGTNGTTRRSADIRLRPQEARLKDQETKGIPELREREREREKWMDGWLDR